MSTNISASDIFASALQLPEAVREELIIVLQSSLVDPTLDHGTEDSPGEVAAAWDEEIAKRIADIDSGRVKLIPSDEAERMIRGELKS
jgi:hypothetical protein